MIYDVEIFNIKSKTCLKPPFPLKMSKFFASPK